jgi:hypothetical protein
MWADTMLACLGLGMGRGLGIGIGIGIGTGTGLGLKIMYGICEPLNFTRIIFANKV